MTSPLRADDQPELPQRPSPHERDGRDEAGDSGGRGPHPSGPYAFPTPTGRP